MATWFRRLAYWLRRSRYDAELQEEIEIHRAMRARHLELTGMAPDDAAPASRRAIGNALLAREDVRDLWLGSVGSWTQDVRYGARALRKNLGFTAAAVITLALGIGVNAGLFTVVNGLLWRDLSAPDAHELVSITQTVTGGDAVATSGEGTFTTSEYEAYANGVTTLDGILAFGNAPQTTLGGSTPQVLLGVAVSCNYFDVLQQPPAVGRGFVAQDCRPGSPPTVVLTHELWQSRFGADRGVVGRSIVLNRQQFTVIGVAAKGTFSGAPFGVAIAGYIAPMDTEPLLRPGQARHGNDTQRWLSLIGRRRDGMHDEEVRADVETLGARFDRQQSGRQTTLMIDRAARVPSDVRQGATAAAAGILAAFGCVLLIACANVANLSLARGTARTHEVAIRLSLGATRGRIIRQLVVESLLLALAGGLLGSLAAVWSVQALLAAAVPALLPPDMQFPFVVDVSPNLSVVIFATLVTLATGLLFGLAPAIQVSRPNIEAMTKEAAVSGGGRRAGRLRGALVGLQVALCMMLTIAAGMLVRGLHATYTVDPGYVYRDVAYASLETAFAGAQPGEIAALLQRLSAAVEGLPGVTGFAYTDQEPLGDDAARIGIRLPGEATNQVRVAELQSVTGAYFDVLEMPIVRGRTFTDAELATSDTRNSPVVVSEATARNLWPGADPLGRRLLWEERTLEVVGVVRDAQVAMIGTIDPYYIYRPGTGPVLLVKSGSDLEATIARIRAVVRTIDPHLVVPVMPLEATLAWWRGISGTVTTLGAGLGGLALILAVVGIYGVVANSVSRRYREIGIRMALGAGKGNILNLIFRQTMRPVVLGAASGAVGGAAVSRLLSVVLFGVSPADPVGLGGAALFVLALAFIAAMIAAHPATLAHPATTLRNN
jgi:macrolide transport system ATP-binding/permease protein